MNHLSNYVQACIKRSDKVFEVSPTEFDFVSDKYCADKIAESSKPIPFYNFRKMSCITTGGTNGAAFIYQIQHIDQYSGNLEAQPYMKHWNEVDLGNRERCYQGMLISTTKGNYVIASKQMIVIQTQEGVQSSLF